MAPPGPNVEERGVVPRALVRRAVKDLNLITVFHSNREALASALDEDASRACPPLIGRRHRHD